MGKTHIAIGLAMETLRQGMVASYITLDDLVRDLSKADQLGSHSRKLACYLRPNLLVINEVGYTPQGTMTPGGMGGPPPVAATTG